MDPAPRLVLFADELRRARNEAGLTQEALGEAIQYSGSLVALVEQCRRSPGRDFTRRCDEVLKTGGRLGRIRDTLAQEALMPWFREWASVEQEATRLCNYEIAYIPGLLQTEEYIQAMLARSGRLAPDEVEEQVAARLERQEVLTRKRPAQYYAVLDDHVLRRQIGGPKVMQDQLVRLVEMAELPNVHLHVVPADVGLYEGLDGAFAIATMADGEDLAYLDHQLKGHVIERAVDVLPLRETWEAVRAEALPHRQTIDILAKAAQSWT